MIGTVPKTMHGVYKAEPKPGAVWREDLPVVAPGPRDVLVHVRAAAICGTDLHIYPWTPWAQQRIPYPCVFGHEFAGEIVAMGDEVHEFKLGDRVAGETHIPCNHCYQCEHDRRHICENMKIIGVHVPGAFSDYFCLPADCAFLLPDEIDDQVGAMLEPMGVGVHGVTAAEVEGKTVAIYGCGPIGLMAIGAAKALGAKRIFATDRFDAKLAVAQKMGADESINSTEQPASKRIVELTAGVGADVVIDYTGSVDAIADCFLALRKGGRFVLVGLPDRQITLDLTESIIYKEATVVGVTGRLMYQTWDTCIDILRSGTFDIHAVIGNVYPMQQFDQAFADLKAGMPGKALLIP